MVTLAANLSTMFVEVPFMDRFAAAARAGFRAVEFHFPYAFGSPAEVAAAARAAGVPVVLHNISAGDETRNERGLGCQPRSVARFREAVEQAVDYARALDCPRLNCLAGIAPNDVSHAEAMDTFAQNIAFAAGKAAAANVRLTVEAVSARAVPGFLINTSRQALEAIDLSGATNAYLQYDVFHMQASEGDLARTIERLLPRIGHIQIADAPGRHEPGTGEINFPWLFGEIDRLGYDGPIGCEYTPANDTMSGLAWAAPYLESAQSPVRSAFQGQSA